MLRGWSTRSEGHSSFGLVRSRKNWEKESRSRSRKSSVSIPRVYSGFDYFTTQQVQTLEIAMPWDKFRSHLSVKSWPVVLIHLWLTQVNTLRMSGKGGRNFWRRLVLAFRLAVILILPALKRSGGMSHSLLLTGMALSPSMMISSWRLEHQRQSEQY